MGSKGGAPPPPDFGPLAAASEKAAKLSYDAAMAQLDWAKERYNLDSELTDLIVETSLDRLDIADEQAARDRARYEAVFQPLEDQLAQDAEDFASPERGEFDAGRAMADVTTQFDAMRESARSQLEQFGIDPSQTRFAAMDLNTRMQEAAARASAGNQARTQSENIGRALRSEAINVGRGYPGQIASSFNTALQSGNQATNAQLATTSTASNAMGTPTQWMGAGNQAMQTWWNGLNTMYGNQVEAFKAEQSGSSGVGSALGLVGGILGRVAMSDPDVKDDITPVGKLKDGQTVYRYRLKGSDRYELGLMADEVQDRNPRAVVEVDGIKHVDYRGATERAAHAEGGGAIPHDGVPVPYQASPSAGAIPDDVPARLTPGEFVVPKDVVAWEGEKALQKLIQRARTEREGAVAKPEVRPAPTRPPAIDTSRSAPPMGGAIPMGA